MKKKVSKKFDVGEAIKTCLRGIAELYPRDTLSPGLVLAWLDKEKLFYASFARYDEEKTKIVIANAKGATLDEAIRNLVTAWRKGTCDARRMMRIGDMKMKFSPMAFTLSTNKLPR